MKELSIEGKATRYDEALKAAVVAHKDEDKHLKATLERIFPELKESEDEKMIQYFKDLAPFDKADELYEKYGFSHKDAIAWLEKQGEQKFGWSEYDEIALNRIIPTLESIKVKAPAYLLQDIIWLKSLKDRVQPQNGYNPYKEVVESIAEMCKHYDKATDLRDFYDNVKVKCKDAKEYDSLFPQSHWKPTEEQMEVLVWCKPLFADPKSKGILESLINDLKKLREEQL